MMGLLPSKPAVHDTLTVLGAVLTFSAFTWVGAYGSSMTSRFAARRSLPPSLLTSQVYSPASLALASAILRVPSRSDMSIL